MEQWTNKALADVIATTLPPGVEPPTAVFDGEFARGFLDVLEDAVYGLEKENDPRLLDALRAKWPDDVERELPAARRRLAEDERRST